MQNKDFFVSIEDRILRGYSHGSEKEAKMNQKIGKIINPDFDLKFGGAYDKVLQKIEKIYLRRN
jgi:hypothetical protein